MGLLQGKVAVVTGSSRGLGFSIAQAFAQEGASVIISSRSDASVEKAVVAFQSRGFPVGGICCDVGEFDQVETLAAYAIEQFDGLDIWVNNAGLSCPMGPTAHIPTEMFTALIRTNILGAYHGSVVAMRRFVPQGSGKLINLVGRGERKPIPLQNPYASSRAWVRNFTLAMAHEYKASGVGVFLLNPGLVETDMYRNLHFIQGYEHNVNVLRVVQRFFLNQPDVPARKAVWLASSATDGRTGLYISVIGPGRLFKGLAQEALRIIRRQAPPPFNPNITVVEPSLDLDLPGSVPDRKNEVIKE